MKADQNNHLRKMLTLLTALVIISLACNITSPAATESAETIPAEEAVPTAGSTQTSAPATNTPEPTQTLAPTDTPLPPTATENMVTIKPGTYLVGTEIQTGIYRGEAGDSYEEACYWARLKDVSGSLEAIIANNNPLGQYYLEIQGSDYAFETLCEIVPLSSLPEPSEQPLKIKPGMYIVGRDIKPGTYKGEAGSDSSGLCYWERLQDLSGEFSAILANDNATGPFSVEVLESDFAFTTLCELELSGE